METVRLCSRLEQSLTLAIVLKFPSKIYLTAVISFDPHWIPIVEGMVADITLFTTVLVNHINL